MAQPIPEIDVLIGVAKWLQANGWDIYVISPPHGQGIGTISDLRAKMVQSGVSLTGVKIQPHGEDIRAKLCEIVWKIECKGLGEGEKATDKNNFDRAIASAVSYLTQEDLRIGLALPEYFEGLLRKKLPQALRMKTNLWVFLYVNADEVYLFSPEDELP